MLLPSLSNDQILRRSKARAASGNYLELIQQSALTRSGLNKPLPNLLTIVDYPSRRRCEEATKSQGTDEDRAITTPQFGQFSALLKLPKFSNLPLIKQLNKVRLHLGEKAEKAYLAYVKRRYESNPNNFIAGRLWNASMERLLCVSSSGLLATEPPRCYEAYSAIVLQICHASDDKTRSSRSSRDVRTSKVQNLSEFPPDVIRTNHSLKHMIPICTDGFGVSAKYERSNTFRDVQPNFFGLYSAARCLPGGVCYIIGFDTMARGRGWSAPETLCMLGLVEQILAFGSNQWNAGQLQYEATGEPSIVEPLPRRLERVV
ncbi:hypothetical protein GQ600_9034 [Phytophthora cactorum]|nr:hypothetical protein GQ600_9034 [Phytophthora cactorum]